MAIASFHDLLVEQLQDLYDAEHQIVDALPKMEKAATDKDLKKAFADHLKETEHQIKRLEQAFKLLEEPAKRKLCHGAQGLLEEGEEALKEKMPDAVRDAAIIAAAQRVEHYEMAGYGSARAFARLMRHDKVADLLQETLDEEGGADEKLTDIAEATVNMAAMEEEPGM